MDPIKIIHKYYNPKSKTYDFLVIHSKMVAEKALKIARRVKYLNPDLKFIQEAAMLHDIGIFLTNTPGLGCYGKAPYVRHGYLGKKVLDKEKLPKHGLVCERHVGVGLSKKDIIKRELPLPKRDMIPITLEEKIICFADKFFSKNKKFLVKEKSVEQVKEELTQYGGDKVLKFEEWLKIFRE
ncbi:MAG: HD domain-containing protein [bacterium]